MMPARGAFHMFNRHTAARMQKRLSLATNSRPIETLERRTLLSAGDLDPSFGLGGIASIDVPGTDGETVTVVDAANGRVVVGGTATLSTSSGPKQQVALAVFDSKGAPVKSFSGDGL